MLAGSRTASGQPILENDPHLTYMAPSVWYLARVETPDLHLAGATIPGTPFVIVGHNDHAGWGFTETGGDAEDLFIEKIDPNDPDRYLTPDGSRPFETRKETIHVKGGDDVTFTVRSTRHGPVVSDVADGGLLLGSKSRWDSATGKGGSDGGERPSILPGKDYVLSLAATFLRSGDLTAQAFWNMDRASTWADFRDGLKDFGAPQMNIVYADRAGEVGFMAPARIPIRKSGEGWLPRPGWTGAYDWTGFIPFDRLPQGANPPSGRFVTANNKIVPDSYPYFIARNWAPPYRADRIASSLDEAPRQTPDSTAAIAADTVSLMARDLVPMLTQADPADERSAEAMRLLKAWDGDMDRGKAAPLIFTAWLRELEKELFAKRLGAGFQRYWQPRPAVLRSILTAGGDWCQGDPGAAPGGCGAVVAHSLKAALDELSKRLGSDVNDWQWGKLHKADFRNIVLSRVPILGSLFKLQIPAPGGSETVNAGDMDYGSAENPYLDIAGPGLRMVLDFSDLSRSRFLMAPGQSENPLSPHYGDLMRPWRDFDWMRIGEARAVRTLELTPKR